LGEPLNKDNRKALIKKKRIDGLNGLEFLAATIVLYSPEGYTENF